MSQENKTPITERWWFKLIKLSTVGVFQGIGRLWRGWTNLSKRGKLGVAGGFIALLVVAGITSQQEARKARELGFASVQEMKVAKKANCPDKACYENLLISQKQAEEAKAAQAQAENASGKGETIGQWMDKVAAESKDAAAAASQQGNPVGQSAGSYAGNDAGDPRFWINGCKVWARANMQCTGNSNYEGCISSRMASAYGQENKDIGLGAGQFCNEDGSTFIKVN